MSSSTSAEPARETATTTVWLVSAVLGAAAFLFSIATFALSNDHFGRISPARQIVQYGELPFRDFFDPGYFLAELSSAALLLLLGDKLIGEALLTCGFVAGGTVLVWLLARRASGSSLGLLAAVLALLTFPRPYDYDKVLFYPLGLLLTWKYVESRAAAHLWALAAAVVVAGLYRYDNAVFIGAAATVSIAVVHARDRKVLAKRLGLFAGASLCLVLPVLAFLQFNGGLANVVDQMVTYGRRETERTRLRDRPTISVDRIASVVTMPPPPDAAFVRWGSIDESSRRAAEARHGLLDGKPRGAPEERTWSYRMADPSTPSVRALLQDPAVEDTSGIDRARLTLTPEPLWIRAQRALPPLRLRLFPGAWTAQNGDALLYQFFRLLPLLAVAVLLLDRRLSQLISLSDMARVTGLATLCFLLNVFIMREPVNARIGGMAGPTAVLAAWLIHRAWSIERVVARRAVKSVVALALIVTVWSVSASAEWSLRLRSDIVRPSYYARVFDVLTASPPSVDALPNSDLRHLVQYLRECTAPRQRVFATWFVPELFFFARRGFAGGITAFFGEHWSEPRFESRSVDLLVGQSPPLVVSRLGDNSLENHYPRLFEYLEEHYELADGSGDLKGYVVHVRRESTPTATYGESMLPCFR